LDVQLQSGIGLTSTDPVQFFEQPPDVTLTLSVVIPEDPAVNVIDWVLLADVILPFVIDQEYAAPAAAVEAALPVDPAQTESGAVMAQFGSKIVISLLHSFEQLPAVTLRLTV
jgi:hypothetical protein